MVKLTERQLNYFRSKQHRKLDNKYKMINEWSIQEWINIPPCFITFKMYPIYFFILLLIFYFSTFPTALKDVDLSFPFTFFKQLIAFTLSFSSFAYFLFRFNTASAFYFISIYIFYTLLAIVSFFFILSFILFIFFVSESINI